MKKIHTLLIEKSSFLRAGVKSLLTQSNYNICAELERASHVKDRHKDETYDLIVYGVNSDDDMVKEVKSLKERFSRARIVVLADELQSSIIQKSYEAGVDGLILKNASTAAFLGYLNLVLLGERVFPTPYTNSDTGLKSTWLRPVNQELAQKYQLSKREIDIVRCLANGDPNKIIARKLDITETTVKTHLKTVLRKLGVMNRTQAAILAVSSGIVESPDMAVMAAH